MIKIKSFCISFLLMACFSGALCQEDDIKICELAPNKIAVFGKFYGQLIFNNGDTLGEYLLTDLSRPNHFLAVCDTQGNFLWSKHLKGASSDWSGNAYGIDIVSDEHQNIYICSSFEDSIQFNDTTVFYGDQTSTAFFAKFDSSGHFKWWLPSIESAGTISEAITMDIDALGNIFAAGSYWYGDVSFGADVLTDNSYNYSIFIVSFDTSGNINWANQMDGGGQGNGSNHNVYDLQVNDDGDFYICGYFGGSFSGSINYGSLSVWHSALTADYRGFILKGDSLGNGIWMSAVDGNNSTVIATDVTLTNTDQMYISGTFENDLTFAALPTIFATHRDHFILAMDTSASAIWSLQASPGMTGIYNYSLGCAADTNDYIYSVMYKSDDVEYFPLPQTNSWSPSVFVRHRANGEAICLTESDKEYEDIIVSADQYIYTVSGDKGWFYPGTAIDIEIQKWNSDCELLSTFIIDHDYYYDVSLSEAEPLEDIRVYPNPVSNDLSVSFDQNSCIEKILIVNIDGKIVLEKNIFSQSTAVFNVSDLVPGIYIVHLISTSGIDLVRFIKL
ncbi:MAG: T9SS type A sorting domain-containing protein [Crocinitomicaceae bacterium]|nr:T9SS type A sorting domain-containing protein [Crocinitomicaceae bacterium]